jgi:hypothetical protein
MFHVACAQTQHLRAAVSTAAHPTGPDPFEEFFLEFCGFVVGCDSRPTPSFFICTSFQLCFDYHSACGRVPYGCRSLSWLSCSPSQRCCKEQAVIASCITPCYHVIRNASQLPCRTNCLFLPHCTLEAFQERAHTQFTLRFYQTLQLQ